MRPPLKYFKRRGEQTGNKYYGEEENMELEMPGKIYVDYGWLNA